MNAFLILVAVVGFVAFVALFALSMREDDYEKSWGLLMLSLAAMVVAMLAGAIGAATQTNEFAKKCEAAGGVHQVIRKGPDLCLRPDAVIELERRH